MPNNIFHQRIAKSFTGINELNKPTPTNPICFAKLASGTALHFRKKQIWGGDAQNLCNNDHKQIRARKDEQITPKQTCLFGNMLSETWHVCTESISCVNWYLLPNQDQNEAAIKFVCFHKDPKSASILACKFWKIGEICYPEMKYQYCPM